MQADVSRTAHELRQSRRWRSIVVRLGLTSHQTVPAGNANQVRAGGVPGKVVHSNEFHALHESRLLAQNLDPSYEGLESSRASNMKRCERPPVLALKFLRTLAQTTWRFSPPNDIERLSGKKSSVRKRSCNNWAKSLQNVAMTHFAKGGVEVRKAPWKRIPDLAVHLGVNRIFRQNLHEETLQERICYPHFIRLLALPSAMMSLSSPAESVLETHLAPPQIQSSRTGIYGGQIDPRGKRGASSAKYIASITALAPPWISIPARRAGVARAFKEDTPIRFAAANSIQNLSEFGVIRDFVTVEHEREDVGEFQIGRYDLEQEFGSVFGEDTA
ncbi:hypothetical protein B0H13DRAFT_1924685 [Mycena leptocephala]|nr:hypothetical protein B0H13DRAFT_1924685 [Mycena leptocephala]